MPLYIVKNDITKMEVDAIVNAANESLLGGGGVDGCIHRAAGEELLQECRALGGCNTGDAKVTRGYRLPCKYVIHTVGPVYEDGTCGERELLESCYKKSLLLAKEHNCNSVAFPLISSGIYGYPKAEALDVAVNTVSAFLSDNEMTVYLVIYDKASYKINENLFLRVAKYVDRNFVDGDFINADFVCNKGVGREALDEDVFFYQKNLCDSAPLISPCMAQAECYSKARCVDDSLNEKLKKLDESFSQMLLRMIDEKGITDVQCYKKANVSRKLFSKIRTDAHYKPSKATVIAFCISLELSLAETEKLLKTAGYALSRSCMFDVIIEYFISQGIYNVFEINEALFAFDQSLLGG